MEVVMMSENIGILLKYNFEKHRLFINNEWLCYEPTLQIANDMLGKKVGFHLNEKGQIDELEVTTAQKLKEMKGKIQSLNVTIPRISMHTNGRLVHFFIPENQFYLMEKYLKPGVYLQFCYHEDEVQIDNTSYYVIAYFKEKKPDDILPKSIKGDLRKALESLLNTKYYVFLDLEFSMSGPEYRGKNFSAEIIQVGLIIVDVEGQIIEKFSAYIKPTAFPNITDKTQEFLKINKIVVENGITYLQFYNYIKEIRARYNPLFIVWGVSDGFVLNSSCALNNVEPLFKENQLIDLQRIHRQFYQIGQDIGLYNAMKSYGYYAGVQIHDALVDAIILHQIFFKFKEIITDASEFPFKENYQSILENR